MISMLEVLTSMRQSGTYKQYSRGPRRVSLDTTFSKGMYTEDNPLPEGAFKHLVNFNLDKDGKYIYPRPGKILDTDIITDQSQVWLTGKPNHPTTLLATTSRAVLPGSFNIIDDNEENDNWELQQVDKVHRLIIATPNEDYTDRVAEPAVEGMGPAFINDTAETPDGSMLSIYAAALRSIPIYSVHPTKIKTLYPFCNEGSNISFPSKDGKKTYTYEPTLNDHFLKTIEGPYVSDDRKVGIKVLRSLDTFKPRPRLVGASLKNNLYTMYNVSSTTDAAYPNDPTNQRGLCRFSTYPDAASTYYVEHVEPQVVTPTTIVSSGFNMLLPNPSSMSNETTVNAWDILGAMVYRDENTEVFDTHYNTGDKVYIRVYWRQPSTYSNNIEIKISYRPSTQTEFTDKLIINNPQISQDQQTGKDPWAIPLLVPAEDFFIKVTITDKDDDNFVKASLEVPFDGGDKHINTSTATTKDLRFINYDLSTATGMLSWKGRLILWGVDKAPDILWSSAPENPAYFPYPDNICTFDEQILYVTTFMDSLLVVTPHEMYEVELIQDAGSVWYLNATLVVNNINISYADTYSILPIKNMIFYKSDNYYYMLVPSTKISSNGELNVAPVSKPINYFLDHFDFEFRDLLTNIYYDEWDHPITEDITLHPTTYRTYIDNDFICLDFSFNVDVDTIDQSVPISYTLKYNIVQRTWTADLYYTPYSTVELYLKNIAGTSRFITYDYTLDEDTNKYSLKPMILTEAIDSTVDTYADPPAYMPSVQYFDTGYKDWSVANKKRMREIIFKINNKLAIPLSFKAQLMIDNEHRYCAGQYGLYQGVDRSMQIINYAKELDTTSKAVYNDDIEPDINDNVFALDDTSYSSSNGASVRWKVSGKGFLPRIKLLSKNKKSYEINGIGWVARLMNAR